MTAAVWLTALVLFAVLAVPALTARGRARTARTCTKHVRVGAAGHLRPTWGGHHRTPGPGCDGPEHAVVHWWW